MRHKGVLLKLPVKSVDGAHCAAVLYSDNSVVTVDLDTCQVQGIFMSRPSDGALHPDLGLTAMQVCMCVHGSALDCFDLRSFGVGSKEIETETA